SSAAPSSSSSRSKASATPRSPRSPASARRARSGSFSRPRDSSRRSGNMNTDDNELDEISAVARTMHATWASDSLLPRIQRAIDAEHRRERFHVWQLAAAVTILAALAALRRYGQRRRREDELTQAMQPRTAAA